MAVSKKTSQRSSRKEPKKASKSEAALKFKRVAVIGSGWYGIESAKAFKRAGGYNVVVFEKGNDLASGTSGICSGRTHKLPTHYLGSERTQEDCFKDYPRFAAENPNVLMENHHAIHGLIIKDSEGNPSKSTLEQFRNLYKKERSVKKIDLNQSDLIGFQEAVMSSEPSIMTGLRLKEELRQSLIDLEIPFICNYEIKSIKKCGDEFVLSGNGTEDRFDVVINATGFQAFIPDGFKDNPLGIEQRYQPCLGLIYEDTQDEAETFSFLAVDGANCSIVPLGEKKYMLTHGIFTLLASCQTPEEARRVHERVTPEFVADVVKLKTETDINRYYPAFCNRYKYIGYTQQVVSKLLTDTEYRAGFSFKDPNGVIHLYPGKIINSGDVADTAVKLSRDEDVVSRGGYVYTREGGLAKGLSEISTRPTGLKEHYTCLLNPYPELLPPTETSRSAQAWPRLWGDSSGNRRPRSNTEEFSQNFSAVELK